MDFKIREYEIINSIILDSVKSCKSEAKSIMANVNIFIESETPSSGKVLLIIEYGHSTNVFCPFDHYITLKNVFMHGMNLNGYQIKDLKNTEVESVIKKYFNNIFDKANTSDVDIDLFINSFLRNTDMNEFIKVDGYRSISMCKVESSCIKEIGYDSIKQEMLIRFHTGSLYSYSVSLATYKAFLESESKGRYYNQFIKDNFSAYKIESESMKLVETKGDIKFFENEDGILFQQISDGDIFKVIDGNIKYKFIEQVNEYQIKYEINGTNGFAIFRGKTILQDGIWVLKEAEKIANEL